MSYDQELEAKLVQEEIKLKNIFELWQVLPGKLLDLRYVRS